MSGIVRSCIEPFLSGPEGNLLGQEKALSWLELPYLSREMILKHKIGPPMLRRDPFMSITTHSGLDGGFSSSGFSVTAPADALLGAPDLIMRGGGTDLCGHLSLFKT